MPLDFKGWKPAKCQTHHSLNIWNFLFPVLFLNFKQHETMALSSRQWQRNFSAIVGAFIGGRHSILNIGSNDDRQTGRLPIWHILCRHYQLITLRALRHHGGFHLTFPVDSDNAALRIASDDFTTPPVRFSRRTPNENQTI